MQPNLLRRRVLLPHKTAEVQMTLDEVFRRKVTQNQETTAQLEVVPVTKLTRPLTTIAPMISHEARRTLTIWLMDLMQNIVTEIAVVRTAAKVTITRAEEQEELRDLLCEVILLL